jgi:hypothetical protein
VLMSAEFKNRTADSWGAHKPVANVATICTDAFWFSAIPYFDGDNTGSNPVEDAIQVLWFHRCVKAFSRSVRRRPAR